MRRRLVACDDPANQWQALRRHRQEVRMRMSIKSALLASVVCFSLAGQALAGDPVLYNGYKVPKDSLGRPVLNGVWNSATMTPFQRMPGYGNRLVMTPDEVAKAEGVIAKRTELANSKTDTNATVKDLPEDGSVNENAQFLEPGTTIMRVHGEPRSSLVTTTPDGYIPLDLNGQVHDPRPQAPATELQRDRSKGLSGAERPDPPGRNDNPESRTLAERCIAYNSTAVIRPFLYNSITSITQSRDTVAIQSEMIHSVRVVRLNGKHRTDGVKQWDGDSIGHYEGATLVVETADYDPRTTMFGGSDQLKITERFTRVSPTRMFYAFTVEDPKTWAKPWGGEYEMQAAPGIYEYACAEGNYGLEAILAGARYDESQTKQASASAGK
jgi:hypothetical protein